MNCRITIVIICFCLLLSCSSRNETNLSTIEIDYLKELNLLEDGEEIILFDSQSSFEQSGNLVTDKRIASYWIDGKNDVINTAFHYEIDSIKTNSPDNSPLYASQLVVYHSQLYQFNIFVDRDKASTQSFFDTTIQIWQKNKNDF